ncbi:MAG TPA: tetratricopeptide repeat protein [Caldisericia bacterium]|nr:tetratricopeptide repeat protein [Caldisericia bacterium]HQL66693.1 tetratricopeptide repeat protein [Caldisericia bacterium]HQO99603.1 tetratricopeptide repeat protein [Caldisericia bacterium]
MILQVIKNSIISSNLTDDDLLNGINCLNIEIDDSCFPESNKIYKIIKINNRIYNDLLCKIYDKEPKSLITIINKLNVEGEKAKNCGTLKALPLFLFKTSYKNKMSYAVIMRKVRGDRFDKIRFKREYENLSLLSKLKLCYQLAIAMQVLTEISIIHGDFGFDNMVIDISDEDDPNFYIIDFDLGSATDKMFIPPGASKDQNEFIPFEIWQKKLNGDDINVDRNAENWTIAAAIHCILFSFSYYFFVNSIVDYKKYITDKNNKWPYIEKSSIYFRKDNSYSYDKYLQKFELLSPEFQEKLSTVFQKGFLEPDYRYTPTQWRKYIFDELLTNKNLSNSTFEDKSYINTFEESEDKYKKAIELNPKDAEAHNNLGVLYYNQNKFKEAEYEYKKAIELNPNHAGAHNNLGGLYYTQKKFKEAEYEFKKAIKLDPDFAVAHYNLGALYYTHKKFKEAEYTFKKVIELNPINANAHFALGNLYFNQNKFIEAEYEIKKAIELKHDYAEAHCNLGVLYSNQNKLIEAEYEYEKALKINPDYAEAHYNLGVLYSNQNKLIEAEYEYKKALKINPDYAEAHYNLGELYSKQNKLKEAEYEYKRAIELNPNYTEAHVGLCLLYFNKNKFKELEHEFKKVIELNPNYFDLSQIHKILGLLYVNQNKFKEAEYEFKKAIELNPEDVEAHNYLGVLYYNQNKFKEAEYEYKRAIELKHDYAEAHHNLGNLFIVLGNKNDAKKELFLAREIFIKEGKFDLVKKIDEDIKNYLK